MITTSDLTKRFNKLIAVDCLTMKIEAGELFGFLGAVEAPRDVRVESVDDALETGESTIDTK